MTDDLWTIPYEPEGRTLEGADCWGLALIVRERLGCMAYPEFPAVRWDRPRANQGAFRTVAAHLLEQDPPQPGAFACVIQAQGKLAGACLHVGVVIDIDGRRGVIDTNVRGGVRWYTLADFIADYAKVVFLNDPANLPERP